ncbi:MAG: hypothetical protein FWE98_06725 [Oscillospiraceae bacterium]|nr:hypothetical protein [Oscillospiraceae bacterium]
MVFLQQLLAEEFQRRGCECPVKVSFVEDASISNKERFIVVQNGDEITITAQGKRGHIFGLGRLLRKLEIVDGKARLVCDISGDFSPRKPIRGHQLGFRGNNNTYDAWTPAQFRRYELDMMFFGANAAEHVPDEGGNLSDLMPMMPNDLLPHVSAIAAELDMDIGLWYPIDHKQPEAEALAERERIFKSMPRLDYLFIPGSDPGDLPPDELFVRGGDYARLMKELHPGSKMWISAQMPHNSPWWPGQFKEELEKLPDWLDGVIMGPNHAFSTERCRRVTPARYDVRLYPDITHNVRCEYPVHYNLDDWHFALASTLSRESVNPRPREFQMLHRQTRGFVSGSVSYSEGVNDDVNKMVWTDLDWFGDGIELRETLEDYARLFLWGADPGRAADGILMLEMNWQGDPAENLGINLCLALWEDLLAKTPSLADNWRFNLLLFRAKCDAYVRQKRLFELDAIARADYDAQYPAGRELLFPLGKTLFEQIGIQLDVENFGGKAWERGCTLDTIDRPITDLPWLRRQRERGLLEQSLKRNEVGPDEFYFSFAHHARNTLACPQVGEFYLNFHGDRDSNDGSVPTCALQVFDNLLLRARLGGFAQGQDYKLRVTWFRPNLKSDRYKITANGKLVFEGKISGGEADPAFDEAMLGPAYLQTRTYALPADVFETGCLALELSEPFSGVMLGEFWVIKG